MKKKYAPKGKIKNFLKNNYLILVLVAIFFLIKVSYLLKVHNVIWDEAVYLGMGKYILSSGELGFWEIIRPVGLPFILGLIWKSGLNYLSFSEIIGILFAVGNITLVYLIGKIMLNKKLAFIASFILAMTSVFFLYTNYILTGIPSTFFILLGIYIYLKRHNLFLAGIFCGIGSMFRLPQVIILAVFGLLFLISLLKDKDIKPFLKNSLLFSSAFVLVHTPYFILNYVLYDYETSKLWHALFRPWILAFSHQYNPAESVLTGTLGSYFYNIFFYVIHLFKENTLLIFIIPAVIFIFRKKLYKKEATNLILIAFFVYLFYFTYISNKQVRFALVFLPYASLIAAYGFYHSFLHTKKDRLRILIVLFVIISLVGVISRDLVYYEWRTYEELPIVRDYYKFFVGKEIRGPILTTDPVPVAYVDAYFIPFYFSPELGYRVYSANANASFATIFSPESFYCSKNDAECKENLKKLGKLIDEKNEVVFSEIYGGRAYYIYLNKDLK